MSGIILLMCYIVHAYSTDYGEFPWICDVHVRENIWARWATIKRKLLSNFSNRCTHKNKIHNALSTYETYTHAVQLACERKRK